ncbi:MAG: hypothetical protein SRB1_02690 [Desulfobacteraceae bacterium Eth-SRB1]|nr:MAG: hypothetical protein SRB1_02690 [Desulfobacteraceae bacterium Eth-SRB1]
MTSKPVALLLADLGITKSHSRPYVSNDNPYSESQFKTMKYRPEFPERFDAIEGCQILLLWLLPLVQYRTLPFRYWFSVTPEDVHYGRAEQIIKEREKVLKIAFENIQTGSRKGSKNRWHYQRQPDY